MISRGEHHALLSLILLASSLSLSIGTVTVPPNENAQSVKVEQVVSIQTVDDQNLLLLNLNDFVNPVYEGSLSNNKGISIQRNTLGSLFYVTNLPHVGELLQAYRLSPCSYVWPSSCQACCNDAVIAQGKRTDDLLYRLYCLRSPALCTLLLKGGLIWNEGLQCG